MAGQNAVHLRLAGPHVEQELLDLTREIWRCVHPREGRILDSASPQLERTRGDRLENGRLLQECLGTWARTLHASGVSERPQVLDLAPSRVVEGVRAGG